LKLMIWAEAACLSCRKARKRPKTETEQMISFFQAFFRERSSTWGRFQVVHQSSGGSKTFMFLR
jgi:hypothetical protein